MEGVSLNLVDSFDRACDLMRWLGERRAGIMALDTETTGLSTVTDDVRLAQLGDEMTGWAIPWKLWSGLVLDALHRYEGDVAFHNAKFDVSFVNRTSPDWFSFDWGRVHDVRTLAHLLDATSRTALKPLAARFIDPRAAALQSQLDEAMAAAHWTWATVPVEFQPYWSYGALDAVLTSRLYGIMRPQVDALGMTEVYDMEVACLPVLARMEQVGTPVDLEYTREKRDGMLSYVASTRQWAMDVHGVTMGSNPALAQRFLELGVVLHKRTPSGASWSMDKEVLQEVHAEYRGHAAAELADVALQSRRLTKLCSTYLTHFLENHVNGRVHCSINPLGARTGRMSVSEPAMQTLPRADDDNPLAIVVRDCVRAPEGYKLVTCDYDQIELRLIGHFSQDPVTLQVLAESDDPFTEFARILYNDQSIGKKDYRRQMFKNCTYARGYGAGVKKFSLTAGVPYVEAEAFVRAYDERIPALRTLQQHVARVAEQRLQGEGLAYVRTPMGRRQVCEPDKTYVLTNYLVQGTAADVMKKKLVELELAGLGQYARLPVHDEVVFEVPEDIAEEVGREAARVMTDTTFSTPLPVAYDGAVERWGDKYK